MPMTKEYVHYVLGTPLGGRPFPKDTSAGRAYVLKKFGKDSIPAVAFFANKLLNQDEEDLSDDEVLICFILVALNTFLCPNSSQNPSPKHFGIFEDLNLVKEFDWSGYVLDWLLKHTKKFSKYKTAKLKAPGTVGGCLYYLAVSYLFSASSHFIFNLFFNI